MLNHHFWEIQFQCKFVPYLTRLVETIEIRLLPVFDNLEKEAKTIEADADGKFMQVAVDQYGNLADPSALAHDAAVAYFMGMSAVKQAIVNVCAPLLYHAWEQQLIEFYRREALSPQERNDHSLFCRFEDIESFLTKKQVSLTSLKSWSIIDELRLVANTTKHADGRSATKLKELRPDLFEPPFRANSGSPSGPYTGPVFTPLSGTDLFVGAGDLRKYGQAIVSFWGEFADALAAADPSAKLAVPPGGF